jgi:TRAP-type C4-dicarboxylate transport system permease small subunit
MYRQLERLAEGIARVMAWAGGIALIALIVMSCLSILGRAGQVSGLPVTSIRGDTEWVEFGTGFVVFAFLPWCTLMRGHASVDLLAPLFGRFNRVLDLLAEVSILIVAALIGWRLWLGLLDKRGYHETTFILRAEVWLGYAAALIGAVAFAVVAAFCVLRAARALTGAATAVPGSGGHA